MSMGKRKIQRKAQPEVEQQPFAIGWKLREIGGVHSLAFLPPEGLNDLQRSRICAGVMQDATFKKQLDKICCGPGGCLVFYVKAGKYADFDHEALMKIVQFYKVGQLVHA